MKNILLVLALITLTCLGMQNTTEQPMLLELSLICEHIESASKLNTLEKNDLLARHTDRHTSMLLPMCYLIEIIEEEFINEQMTETRRTYSHPCPYCGRLYTTHLKPIVLKHNLRGHIKSQHSGKPIDLKSEQVIDNMPHPSHFELILIRHHILQTSQAQ